MTVGEAMEAAHRFPFSALIDRLERGAIVVMAPHPDDESLACGGLIATARAEGWQVAIVFVSDGVGSHPNSEEYPPLRLKAVREEEAKRACCELGVDAQDQIFLGLPDRFVPSQGDEAEAAIARVVDRVNEIGAKSLFVSWRHDPHCDHQASYLMGREVQRRVPQLRMFEYIVWGETLPRSTRVQSIGNGFRIHIDCVLEQKRRAISAHRSQISDLISDAPDGFRLTAGDLARFDLPYEYFIDSDA